jgi:hypothetical protein
MQFEQLENCQPLLTSLLLSNQPAVTAMEARRLARGVAAVIVRRRVSARRASDTARRAPRAAADEDTMAILFSIGVGKVDIFW